VFDQSFTSITTARYIPAFLAVARHKSFTKAASALYVSQPAVTMAVHQLEELIGVRLFVRNTRAVSLTPEGRRFVPTAERLLADLDAGIRSIFAAPSQANQTRIAAVPSVATKVLPTALAQLAASDPEVRVVLQDANSINVWRRIRWNEADIGFASATDTEPDLIFTPLFRDRIGLLARTGHSLFALSGAIDWQSIGNHEFIGLAGDVAGGIIGQTPGLPENVRTPCYEASYNTVLWAMLQEGDRINAIPALFAPDRVATGLSFRTLQNPVVWRTVYAVSSASRPPSFNVTRIVALVKQTIAEIGRQNPAVEPL
jgi:LysR family transcriptional regulator, carnitine catabolism transcriptional activator